MPRAKIAIDKEHLKRFYIDKNLSTYEIAGKFGCSFATITNRLREYGIPLKSPALARTRYPKKDFTGSASERSYLLGFRLGDLNCYQRGESSETIVARCHTTDPNQVAVMRNLFKRYGRVSVCKTNGHYQVNCFLNTTFNFLLTKEFSADKLDNFAFIAGYTDAEGSFQINDGRARFKIDSYDFPILSWISEQLSHEAIPNKFRRLNIEGQTRSDGSVFKSDLWRLNINSALAIRKFVLEIQPYSRHKKRQKDMALCLENIETRLRRGSIIESKQPR